MKQDMQIPPRRILFIVNPISGGRRERPVHRAVEAYLDKGKYKYRLEYTKYKGHAEELAREAVAEGVAIVVAVGGDGTVNEVSRSLVGTPVALAVIPTGSGNGLARHLGLPLNLKRAIQVINRGVIKPIDTASLNGHFFINVAGTGFDAYVARQFEQSMRRGFFSYFQIATQSYKHYKPRNFRIIIDGKEVKRKALMINFANSSQFGNNTSINPQASIDDGLIDVCIVNKLPYWKVGLLFPLLFLKRFDRTPFVEVIKARSVIVKRKKGRYVQLDGDPEKEKKMLHVEVHPLSLQVIVSSK